MQPELIFAQNLRTYERDGDYLARHARKMKMSRNRGNFTNGTGSPIKDENLKENLRNLS